MTNNKIFILHILLVYLPLFSIAYLHANGVNVCQQERSVMVNATKIFYRTVSETYETCCDDEAFYCHAICTRQWTRTVSYMKISPIRIVIQPLYFCCKGFERMNPDSIDCRKALCGDTSCPIGSCTKCSYSNEDDFLYPNEELKSLNGGCCFYNSKSTDIKETLANKEKCGEHVSMNSGTSLKLYGTNKNWLLDLEQCRWHINIKSAHARLTFENFNFDPAKTTCGESLITLRNATSHLFHYCSTLLPAADDKEGVEVYGTELVLEVVRKGWQAENGFKLNFILK